MLSKVVIGDFNSKIGARATHENDVMGLFGYGTRNERGERWIRFCRKNQLFVTNTMFKRKTHQKWTWRSPDFSTKNEIDFILTSSKSWVRNVSLEQFGFFDWSSNSENDNEIKKQHQESTKKVQKSEFKRPKSCSQVQSNIKENAL
jgi:hypothetical protein